MYVVKSNMRKSWKIRKIYLILMFSGKKCSVLITTKKYWNILLMSK